MEVTLLQLFLYWHQPYKGKRDAEIEPTGSHSLCWLSAVLELVDGNDVSVLMRSSLKYSSKYVCPYWFSVFSSHYVARLSTTNMQLPQQVVCEQVYALYNVDVW
jgi:hypothetical protein